jgi:hypothetical protein
MKQSPPLTSAGDSEIGQVGCCLVGRHLDGHSTLAFTARAPPLRRSACNAQLGMSAKPAATAIEAMPR